MRLIRLNSSGDTIVEVLLAVAIVSFVIASASAISGSATNTLRDSHERGEALKLAETQLEQIVANKELPEGNDCFGASGEPKKAEGTNCAFKSGGGGDCDPAVSSYCYNVSVQRVSTETGDVNQLSIAVTYNIEVTWDRLGGGLGTVSMSYKSYVDNPAYTGAGGNPNVNNGSLEITVGGQNNGGGGGPGNGGCPGAPGCPTSGTFHYRRTFTFLLLNGVNQSEVSSCTWNFGDGKTETYPASSRHCQEGGTIQHDFPEEASYPEGAACNFGGNWQKTDYRVVLTVTTKAGRTVPSNDATTSVPYCSN